jgi:hypothetical protein
MSVAVLRIRILYGRIRKSEVKNGHIIELFCAEKFYEYSYIKKTCTLAFSSCLRFECYFCVENFLFKKVAQNLYRLESG